MKKISVCIICLLAVFVFTACGKPKFDGAWEICTSDGIQLGYKVNFRNDGQVKIYGINEEYEVIDSDTIKISGDKFDFDSDMNFDDIYEYYKSQVSIENPV